MGEFKDNAAKSRFELIGEGGDVFADYRMDGERLVISYVYAAPELRGSGAAGRLMKEVAEHARAGKLKIVPLCGYASAWMQRHDEYAALIA